VNFADKCVILEASIEIGNIISTQIMYSAFFPTGNLVVLFTPVLKDDERDFSAWAQQILSFQDKDVPQRSKNNENTTKNETILSKVDTDTIFSLTRQKWETYIENMVHPNGWKVRYSKHDTGSAVMAYDSKTGYGLSIQPFYKNDDTPPDILIVSSYYPSGTLPRFTDDVKTEIESEARRDLGSKYAVSASYTKMPPYEGIELMITKGARK